MPTASGHLHAPDAAARAATISIITITIAKADALGGEACCHRSCHRRVLVLQLLCPDAIDKAARSKLRAEGAVRYEKISQEEIEDKEATREAIRQQARGT